MALRFLILSKFLLFHPRIISRQDFGHYSNSEVANFRFSAQKIANGQGSLVELSLEFQGLSTNYGGRTFWRDVMRYMNYDFNNLTVHKKL